MCWPGNWFTPAYANVRLEERPRVYYPNYYYPNAYPQPNYCGGGGGYGVARGVYYAPPKLRVKGPKARKELILIIVCCIHFLPFLMPEAPPDLMTWI